MNELQHHQQLWNTQKYENINEITRYNNENKIVIEAIKLRLDDTVKIEEFN